MARHAWYWCASLITVIIIPALRLGALLLRLLLVLDLTCNALAGLLLVNLGEDKV